MLELGLLDQAADARHMHRTNLNLVVGGLGARASVGKRLYVAEARLELAAGGECQALEPEDLIPRQALVDRLHVLEIPGRGLLRLGLQASQSVLLVDEIVVVRGQRAQLEDVFRAALLVIRALRHAVEEATVHRLVHVNAEAVGETRAVSLASLYVQTEGSAVRVVVAREMTVAETIWRRCITWCVNDTLLVALVLGDARTNHVWSSHIHVVSRTVLAREARVPDDRTRRRAHGRGGLRHLVLRRRVHHVVHRDPGVEGGLG